MPGRTTALSISAIPRYRLQSQQITGTKLETAAEIVGWFGAMQAQDYLASLWAVGLRTPGATERSIEQAIADGSIVRTWPMRGTLHFVAAADARWMLELMTPRVIATHAKRLKREYDIDERVCAQSAEVLRHALQGGGRLSRPDIYRTLEAAGIPALGQRGLHILGRLAQERVVCFGPREGKQPTFLLFDEWLPGARSLDHDEALERIATRYFTSHGPATLHDFTWWSGLTMADARTGVEMAREHLRSEEIDGVGYWLSRDASPDPRKARGVDLLPAYDEYTVAYRDRSAVLAPESITQTISSNGIFNPIIVIDGRVAGTWKRTLSKGTVIITPNPFRPLTRTELTSLAKAAARYAAFLSLPTETRFKAEG